MSLCWRASMASLVVGISYLLALHLPTVFLSFTSRKSFEEVARIPYGQLVTGDPSVDPRIYDSMREYGFFFVVNITENYDSSVELAYLKQFFQLEHRVKMALAVNKHNPANTNVYRGYGPPQDSSGTQYKELFNIGPHETPPPTANLTDDLGLVRTIGLEQNVWPVTSEGSFDRRFKEVFRRGFELRREVARAVVESISRSLGYPALPQLFTHHEFSTLGLRKYPQRKKLNNDMFSGIDNVLLSELEHEDSTVTVLSTFNNTGLQALYEGSYMDVPVTDNDFMINIGTLISELTDNRVIAVNHRVKQISNVRYSIPFFYNPSIDADISTSLTGHRTTAGQRYRKFGEWMRDYLPKVEPALLRSSLSEEEPSESPPHVPFTLMELRNAADGIIAL